MFKVSRVTQTCWRSVLCNTNEFMWWLAIAKSLVQKRLAATLHRCMDAFLKLLPFVNVTAVKEQLH